MNNKKEIIKVLEDGTIVDIIFNSKNYLSKKKIKQYIKYEMVYVNDRKITNNNYLVKKNDIITVYYERKVIKENNLEILYEDDDLIAINKPSGLLSISNNKEKEVTAFKMVREYVRSKNPKIFLFTIHRIDEDTSGVLMFAKNEKTKHLFQDNWNNIVKKRIYIAVVEGRITKSGTFHTYLKESKTGMVYSSKDKSGKEAITEYKVLKNKNNLTLLEVNILTGRRNQIRVHMSENNTPIVGDKKYGSKSKERLMLHAKTLELIDPRTNKILTITKDAPREFYEMME